jgi:hypothetical protein
MDGSTGKWVLNIGCHRNTMMSRETDYPREFNTREEAVQSYQDSKNTWARFGYVVWFANLTSPDGQKTTLESNSYQSSW